MAATGPHVGFAGAVVRGAVRIGGGAVEARHEQHGQLAADHVQLGRPEAAGHRAAFAVAVAAGEQVDFAVAAAGGIRQVGDGRRHAQRHVRAAAVWIDAVAVGIVGGNEHEELFTVVIPCEHGRIGAFDGERHGIVGLADATADRTAFARLEPASCGVVGEGGELCGVPVDGAHGGGSVGVLQFGRGAAERADEVTGFAVVQIGRDGHGRHGDAGVVNAAEACDERRGFLFGDVDFVAGDGVRDAVVATDGRCVDIVGIACGNRFGGIVRFGRQRGADRGDDVGADRAHRVAVVVMPPDDVPTFCIVVYDRGTVYAGRGAKQHQSALIVRRQVAAGRQQERRPFGSVRAAAARGAGRRHGEPAGRQPEQVRILEAFEFDVHAGHRRAVRDGVAGGSHRRVRIGLESCRRGARTSGFGRRRGDRHAGSEEDAVVFVKRRPRAVEMRPQRQVHAEGDVLVVRLFARRGDTRIAQQ